MQTFLNRLIQFVLRLVFWLSAAVLGAGLLVLALVLMAVSLLRWAITGRKPAPVMAFSAFRRFKEQTARPQGAADLFRNRNAPRQAQDAQVVDVEAREIREITDQPTRP
ncbi:MAG: hypothetical protein V4731_17050 [Pseudomonadota bacterium]